jgi:CheY-like chemotaxis protein
MKILVVDDHVDTGELLEMLCLYRGHEVTVTTGAAEALGAAARVRPDLVLLDIGLPGINGFEVATRLRAARETSHARVVALSGYSQKDFFEKARQVGFDAYLMKPVKLEDVLEQIAACAKGDGPGREAFTVHTPAPLPVADQLLP